MKLSIIIPAYNVEKYLAECLESVFCQGLDNDDFEVLLIDDGSMDTSLQIANRWAKQHPNIRVFHQENQGQAVARNLGIDNAKGDYLMFVDSDDYILPNKIKPLLFTLAENKLDSIIFNAQKQEANGVVVANKIGCVEYNRIYSGEEVALRHYVFGCVWRNIFSRQIFIDNNLYFSSGFTHEDSELCFRLYPRLKRVLFVDEEIYFYRYNEQSTDRSTAKVKLRRNIESDAIVVSKILSGLNNYSEHLQHRYRKIANSMMVSFFIRIKDNDVWQKEEFNERIEWLKSIKVYPIEGMTSSWKSYCLSKLLNFKHLLKLYLFSI